jgi:hypothetical protein
MGADARRAVLLALTGAVLLGLTSAAYAVCCICQSSVAQNVCLPSSGGPVVNCSDCTGICGSFGGPVLACCGTANSDCSNGVADDCAFAVACLQVDSSPDGFCKGTCLAPTSTPTTTPTATPTLTPTSTPTPTPLALGDPCTSNTQCASTFCAPGGVCCNAPCTAPAQSCTLPGSLGLCRLLSAAPALSLTVFVVLAVLLTGVGVLALTRRRIRSSGEFR